MCGEYFERENVNSESITRKWKYNSPYYSQNLCHHCLNFRVVVVAFSAALHNSTLCLFAERRHNFPFKKQQIDRTRGRCREVFTCDLQAWRTSRMRWRAGNDDYPSVFPAPICGRTAISKVFRLVYSQLLRDLTSHFRSCRRRMDYTNICDNFFSASYVCRHHNMQLLRWAELLRLLPGKILRRKLILIIALSVPNTSRQRAHIMCKSCE